MALQKSPNGPPTHLGNGRTILAPRWVDASFPRVPHLHLTIFFLRANRIAIPLLLFNSDMDELGIGQYQELYSALESQGSQVELITAGGLVFEPPSRKISGAIAVKVCAREFSLGSTDSGTAQVILATRKNLVLQSMAIGQLATLLSTRHG